MSTPAQEEYNRLILKNAQESVRNHPSDNADAQSFLNLSEDEDNINTPRNRNLQSSRHENNNDDDDEDTFPPRPSYSTTRSTTTIPHTRYEANTGPKGVISDAQNFRDARRDKRISLSQQQQQRPLTEAGKLGQRLGELNFGEKEAAARGLESLGLGQEDQDEYLDEGDEGFMREWRMRRLREMQEASSGGAGLEGRFLGGGGGRRGGSGRRFGALSTVDGEGYLEAVDGSGEGTVVVVCIYDDMSDVSQAIESCIRTLAAKHLDARFVKLHYQDAEMEPAGVPALIAYQNGEKFAGLVPIMEALPDDADLSALTLEMVMKRHQILR